MPHRQFWEELLGRKGPDDPDYPLECTGSAPDPEGNEHKNTKRHHCNLDPAHKKKKKPHRCHCGFEWPL